MRTINLPATIVICAILIGVFSFPVRTMAEATAASHPDVSNSQKSGMQFSAGDGKPGHFRLVCHDVSAYDALVAIAKRSGYQLTFDPAGEAACRRMNLNGVYCQPWMGLDGARIESVIAESVSTYADVPSGHLVRFVRAKTKNAPARVTVVNRTALDASGQVAFASPETSQRKTNNNKRK
ncbi:MAG TPA: hypothetical protein VK961_01235 [Chthoniobacter sp.]|nr:hypothetical protein [Chthoniobacter sp.]